MSTGEEKAMTPAAMAGILFVFLAAGCAGPQPSPDTAPAKAAPAQESVEVPVKPVDPVAKSEPAPARPAPSEPAATAPAPKPEAPVAKAETPKPEAPRPVAKAPAQPAPRKETAAPPAPKPPALDLASLEKRLKETEAIGVFTKLTLKNQVDDLLGKFRAYYSGQLKTSLAQLRQPYDLLILKVLSLLQDGDPALARAVADSREAIWGILSDPEKFRNL